MRFFNPKEFDFVLHWSEASKKFIAAFFFKRRKSYPYIETEDYFAYIRYRVFMEYKKNQKLEVNSKLFGKLRSELYRMNKKRRDEIYETKLLNNIGFNHTLYDEKLLFQNLIEDIKKICCKNTAIALRKKLFQEELSQNEYYLLRKNRDKIVEYIKI